MRQTPLHLLTAALLAAALAASAVAGLVTDLPVGAATPNFTLPRTDGGSVTLLDEYGKPIVLVFADMRQQNSQDALSDLASIFQRGNYGDAVKVFVVVDQPGTAEELEAARRAAGIPFPVLIDADHTTFSSYGVIVEPSLVFLDSHGLLQHTMAAYGVAFADTVEDELAYLTGRITREELLIRRRGPETEDAATLRLQRLVHLADQMRERGLTDQARQQYSAVLEEAPSNVDANLGLALIEIGAGQLGDAEQHARAALEHEPNLPQGLKILARVQITHGDTDGAEATLQTLVNLAGQDEETLYLLGRVAEARGNLAGAAQDYRRACESLLEERRW
jgi:peroxiredoxin/Tfp pilus assembly protein PilF